MSRIPHQVLKENARLPEPNVSSRSNKIVFSFEAVEQNEFFNLDATCENWSKELFGMMKIVSNIELKDIQSGMYSRKGSTLRIHRHQNAQAPCALPNNVLLENMWQIRISNNKGGIHGRFVNNVFYVIWFDPHHNLYPNKNYGGLRKIKAPQNCCKERDEELARLNCELAQQNEEKAFLEKYIRELEDQMQSQK